MKILLLEDDFVYRESVSEYLESLGYEVDEAADVRMHILKIRQKTAPEFIKSSRGLGYKIDVSKS